MSILDEFGNPIELAPGSESEKVDPDAPTGDLEPPKVFVPITAIGWEPDLSRPLSDLEVVALAYNAAARFIQAQGSILDPDEVEALFQSLLEKYSKILNIDQVGFLRWRINECLFEVLSHTYLQQQQRLEQNQRLKAEQAQRVIDEMNRPDKRKGRRNGSH